MCVVTTVSGDPASTNLVRPHPNRQVLFLDNSKPIPFVQDPNNPDHTYQIGFSLSNSVRKQIAEFEPTVIHLTCPDCTALHLIEYARRMEIPIMGTYHSNIPEYMEHYPGMSWLKHVLASFFRHQYNFLQALYVPTPFIKRHLAASYRMDRVTNVNVWGHGVDIAKFHPSNRSQKFRRNLGIADHQVVLVWVSRLVPEKRPDIFANVVRRLAARNVAFRALVIGAGPCEDEIKGLPNTTFCGWMNEDQLSVAYASSDVFLFPSAVETFGLVTLEAAASGLPVIVESECSGHLVRNGETGYACPAGDEDAFFEATYDLVTNRTKRLAFSKASRNLTHSWEKRAIVRKMVDYYSEIREEFFTEYGGSHANRDAVYRKSDSFGGGSHPRPLLLIMIEWLFIAIFHAIWNMTQGLQMVQSFLFPRNKWDAVQASAAAIAAKKVPSPPPTIPYSPVDAGSAIVEFSDADLEPEILSATFDDGTASTSSSTHEEVPAPVSPYSCAVSPKQSFGDCALAHTLAKRFIFAVQAQCRMESYIRRTCSSVLCRRNRTSWRGPVKRKNSFDMYDESDLMKRSRSDVCEPSFDSQYAMVPLANEGSRLRRNLSSVGV